MHKYISVGFLWFVIAQPVMGDGTLSDNVRIESKALGYALQYRVYTPDTKFARKDMATLYVTDGQWYISEGKFPTVLDHEIETGVIEPVVVVFIDSRSPDDLQKNLRNEQFFCNGKYATFYVNELIPAIDKGFDVSSNRDKRVILGFSFGATNSACFGLMIPQAFGGIAMQSPANDKHLKMIKGLYKESERLPLKLFMSFGTKNDNVAAGRRFRATLDQKEYDLTYREVREAHNWKNWGPLLDDVLITFFSK